MATVQEVSKQEKSVREVAAKLGVSRQMVHKWLARHRAGGGAGLHSRGPRRNRSLQRLAAEQVAIIAALSRRS